MNNITLYNEEIFEQIKHIDENGSEYWEAGELQKVLNYKEWRKFERVVNKAKDACQNSNNIVFNHFVATDKMVKLGSGSERKILEQTIKICLLFNSSKC